VGEQTWNPQISQIEEQELQPQIPQITLIASPVAAHRFG
jgi:hypothetical protein